VARDGADRGRRAWRTLLLAWVFLYAFVSSQMTWRLSPLVGDPARPFILLQPLRDNFSVDAMHAFERMLGTPASLSSPTGLALWFP